MMTHTYKKRGDENDEIWKIEIFSRIIRYEKQFPELWSVAHKPTKVITLHNHFEIFETSPEQKKASDRWWRE